MHLSSPTQPTFTFPKFYAVTMQVTNYWNELNSFEGQFLIPMSVHRQERARVKSFFLAVDAAQSVQPR